MLTIAYTTGRVDPKLGWFLESLARETGGDYSGIEIVVVDRCFGMPGRHPDVALPPSLIHVPPKPTVWQGSQRRTKEDWFAVSNTRNTAICHAKGEWIAFVDDLSFLSPGWLTQVRQAMGGHKKITCGAYQKVKKLVIEKGNLVGYETFPQGFDNRMRAAGKEAINGPVPCTGNWMYGCSLVAPVEAFLSCNGYDERCDGLGFEDVITGIHIAKKGWRFCYDMKMLTIESEEDHHVGGQLKRSDYGVSPKDKSHRILELAQTGDGWCPNNFGPFSSLALLREHIQRGGQFPKVRYPEREWFTGVPLSEL